MIVDKYAFIAIVRDAGTGDTILASATLQNTLIMGADISSYYSCYGNVQIGMPQINMSSFSSIRSAWFPNRVYRVQRSRV